ncbi:MAG: DNA recombination/repair protein RecA, partial [Candidatus Omnitrophica bacterium]|nr:DNA recombination/repair protein RecA [Candidatus Omnitrophota bacterium]
HNEGISKAASIIDAGTNLGVIEKSGSWLSFAGEKLAQGREAAIKLLKEKPKLQEDIEKEIRKRIFLNK